MQVSEAASQCIETACPACRAMQFTPLPIDRKAVSKPLAMSAMDALEDAGTPLDCPPGTQPTRSLLIYTGRASGICGLILTICLPHLRDRVSGE